MIQGSGFLHRFRLNLTILAALSTLVACSRAPQSPSNPNAISNRPQTYDRFVAILKLQAPALLTSAKLVDGALTVDEAAKTALAAEQAAVLAELNALSPDIRVLYRYKLVLNGLAIVAPKALEARFKAMSAVSYVEREQAFARMAPTENRALTSSDDILANNSVKFIGADRIHRELTVSLPNGETLPVTGRGIRVGVIDTGIDYTHSMFGGLGTVESYTANDPNIIEANSFPTAKVVGGIDLVGTDYNSNAADFNRHIPVADADPLDEAGHGSHVAGTIAGIGDGRNTYSGVAPEAQLVAIKVFGKDGSTGDAVTLAALEYAANPAGDLNLRDRLDVVNMSLGSGFGTPHILYSEAVKNLVNSGTLVAASAGNSGANSYIVGAPSTSDEAVSIAASIDGMDHNWKFAAVAFTTATEPNILAEAVEATFSKTIAEAGAVHGKLVYIGLAAADLSDAQKAELNGHVALIDRGAVAFTTKAQRALEAGAIGVVVANNVDGAATVMGGDVEETLPIPAIMITKALGDVLKSAMTSGEVTIAFQTDQRIERPELIDTLTSFSSRGPRSVDGAIKPEVSAPGYNVISAKMGSGHQSTRLSGTSMAAPHIAGVMALLKQLRPGLQSSDYKSLLVNTAKSINNPTAVLYPVAQQGGGRVQAFAAANAAVVATPASLSLGEIGVESAKVVRKTLTLTNLSDTAVTVTLTPEVDAGLTVSAPTTLSLPARGSQSFTVKIKIAPSSSNDASLELDGFLKLAVNGALQGQIPLLAVVNKVARIVAKDLKVAATSEADAAGADAELTLVNRGQTAGDALIFNLLGRDQRKESSRENPYRNKLCDMESAGYRVIKKEINGVPKDILQVAVKLYQPVTSWHLCEISIQLDQDADGIADQELLGTYLQLLTTNAADAQSFASVLTDGAHMRRIRHDFEIAAPGAAEPIYTPAILDSQELLSYAHSTLAVVSADLSLLAKTARGDLVVKVAVLSSDLTSPEADDFLDKQDSKWKTITPATANLAFVNLPESVAVAAGETKVVELTKGGAKGGLVVYLPHNQTTAADTGRDVQSTSLAPQFIFGR